MYQWGYKKNKNYNRKLYKKFEKDADTNFFMCIFCISGVAHEFLINSQNH